MKTASWWLSLVMPGMIVLLRFCGASGGSTLFTLGNPCMMELPRGLIICVDMGVPLLCCALQPFGLKTLSQAYALVLGCTLLFVLLLQLDLDHHSNLRIMHNTAYY
jgi:hypothetical protein